MINKIITPVLCTMLLVASCGESDAERIDRLQFEKEEQFRIEESRKARQEAAAERAYREEQNRIEQEKRAERERIAREIRLENERKEREIYNRYINNSLRTGSTPYARYYGGNPTCDNYGCSEIRVKTSNSDVIVTIKKNGRVVRHAYINSRSSYTFSFPNGTYQTFFYYGQGWNPEKEMKGGRIKGGFISNESFGKDSPQYLNNNSLTYELILQSNGNFSTRPSNPEEAL